MFEDALCEYTGAAAAVAVDSCSNALFLSLLYCNVEGGCDTVEIPRHTYVGVPQAALNAGMEILWHDNHWRCWYKMPPTNIIDSAKYFERGMYVPGTLMCVSFHIAKRLPLGHGGAILLDDEGAEEWLRRARFDGRTQGQTGEAATKVTVPGWHMHMTPDDAARGLWLLNQYVDQPLNADWSHYPDCSELM